MSEGSDTSLTAEDSRALVEAEVRRELETDSHSYYEGRPLTYFMYPSLTWEELERFLRRHKASQACLDKAILDLEKYHLSQL